jgi:hypothetical protein
MAVELLLIPELHVLKLAELRGQDAESKCDFIV